MILLLKKDQIILIYNSTSEEQGRVVYFCIFLFFFSIYNEFLKIKYINQNGTPCAVGEIIHKSIKNMHILRNSTNNHNTKAVLNTWLLVTRD